MSKPLFYYESAYVALRGTVPYLFIMLRTHNKALDIFFTHNILSDFPPINRTHDESIYQS